VGVWAPSNNHSLGLTRVHNPSSTSIGSAVFAGLTAEHPYTLQWTVPLASKVILPMEDLDPHLTHAFLEPTRAHNQNGISIG